MKKFEINDLEYMQILVEKKLKDIFYQPVNEILSEENMLVFNFGNTIEFSLHVFCFCRIIMDGKILLTSSDEYFDENYNKLSLNKYNKALQNKFKNTLMTKNCLLVKNILKKAIVKELLVNSVADIRIIFDNNVILEIIPDCLYSGYEYYRFFKYKCDDRHIVVMCKDGEIILE